MNEKIREAQTSDRRQDTPLETVRFVLSWLLVLVVIRTVLVEPFTIPSGSMIPTLQVGDYVFVTKFDYGWSRFSLPFSPDLFKGRIWGAAPHRGDVAVFRYTQNTSEDYIKRIIGLPGDHVQVTGGELYINGEKVPRRALGAYSVDDERGDAQTGMRYLETLPPSKGGVSVTHQILKQTDAGEPNNTREYIVPEGYFFAMGDNRDNSSDSRFQADNGRDLGYVPMVNLVGKARFVWFSYEARHPVWQFWQWPFEIRWSHLFAVMD
ncbi:signal peptidase I [Swaminathania salitolerans]|uniref:Signal peptidase I n=1 Tax=Swaminathania salitolerans TaxID=182838 RepID=A0A511BM51_9PROT|nr:signal peptidase I [Swaminathania salitolerans]GBQ15602.1 signal peptidase I [Swaminathania salitolerans LMG 21291]GEL01419.1 signal peptidase I [Swaminathania salitolerans]